MIPDYFSPNNVLVVTFGEDPKKDTNAYQALTDLKQLDSQGQIDIAGAAVVTRDPDGRVDVKSEVGDAPCAGTASGGILGLLIGIIGGPLGMLLGGTYGMLVGSLFDIEDEIAAAEEAQRKAKREARKELHRARVDKTKADAHAKVEELKSRLSRGKAGATA